MPVRVTGRYDILETLGEGGMGIVYRALDTKTGSLVAIKTMRDATDPLAVELFTKEWRVLAEISHPNIVDIRDVDSIEEDAGRKPFFVMPLLRGVTLGELIASSSQRLTVERVVDIMCQVCRGLQAAHQSGLVHRDLKPSNIFVMDDDTAKIIDFGVVHLAGTNSVTGHKGTWQYMAPEQIELKPTTPVSDIFSLGVVCYEALTLRKPFARNTPGETVDAVRKYIPPPVSDINPAVSPILSKVIHKAMAKQPMHRFASAREFAEMLQKASRNLPIERFDRARIQPRIERAKKTFAEGDYAFASDILTEIEAEGHLDPDITVLRGQIEEAVRQKKVRQLLEGARSRLEEDEIPLALDKVREILEIDPENSDALSLRASVEKTRNERQIQSWLVLARQHLDRNDFSQARQAAREVLSIRSGDERAMGLLAETEESEQEASRIRAQREQLYGSALRAYQNGEISSALSKLEKVLTLARQTPAAVVPERDAVYQSFYNQVRTERDAIHNAYEEGRRHLSEKEFGKALEVCERALDKRPSDALFQALKLEVVETQRQELSAYIAEVGRRVENEPDLDRRVNILRDACDRYPQEQQFQQSLRLARERRDLLQSIVVRARQYEENGQFAEAIGQFDILRSIHPQYPGIDVEMAQLLERREQQVREDEKARLVQQIDRALEAAAYGRAHDLARGALADFPADRELESLEQMAREGLERTEQARRLFEAGQRACAEERNEEGIDLLNQSLKTEPNNPDAREALVNALVQRARAVLDEDWRSAELLVNQAGELDEAHAAVRGTRAAVAAARRKESVALCLSETRQLQAAGDPASALARIEQELSQYPGEARLEQFRSNLRGVLEQSKREQDRKQDEATLEEWRNSLRRRDDPEQRRVILEKLPTIRHKHPDDPRITTVVAEIEQIARGGAAIPRAVDETALYSRTDLMMESPLLAKAAAAAVSGPAPALPQPDPVAAGSIPEAVTPPDATAAHDASDQPGLLAGIVARVREIATRRPIAAAAVGIVVLILAVSAVRLIPHPPPKPTAPPPPRRPGAVSVVVSTTPPDAAIAIDGKPLTARALSLLPGRKYHVEVTRPGYQARTFDLQPGSAWAFTLDPEPLHIRVQTSQPRGQVYLDGRDVGELEDGSLADFLLPPDGAQHKLTVRSPADELLAVEFQAMPGVRPVVTPLGTKDLVVLSNLGPAATLYSATASRSASLDGQASQTIPNGGLDLPPLTAAKHEIQIGEGKSRILVPVEIGNAPVLWISLRGDPNLAHVNVTANPAATRLFVDDVEVKRRRGRWQITRPPGNYTLKLIADGYDDLVERIALSKGQTLPLNRNLIAKPVTAVLVMEGGTPDAEVTIAGRHTRLDANGAGQIEGVPFGSQKIVISKDGFEPRDIERDFSARKPRVELHGKEFALAEPGTLLFEVVPATAAVEYRNVEDHVTHGATASGSVTVRPGRYEITAAADGYEQERREYAVTSGQPAHVDLKLRKIAAPPPAIVDVPANRLFEDQTRLEFAGGWLRTKAPGYAYMMAGPKQVNLVFVKPGKDILKLGKQKKVAWVVSAAGGKSRITWELDDHTLTRRPVIGGEELPSKQINVNAVSGKDQYSVVIRLDTNRVVITTSDGRPLDEFVVDGSMLGGAKIGIKTDARFVARLL